MQELTEMIRIWLADRKNNALTPESEFPAFAEPLVGCAAGDDPLFAFLKQDIGPEFYWTPQEAFRTAFSSCRASDADLSVISWVLPQTERTRAAHRQATNMPSIEWSCARHYGEQVNENLRRHVVGWFTEQGVEACAPALLPQWRREQSVRYGFASRWSERHTAYACGLGTFGLSDGLITPVGKSIRLGSVVVNKQYAPTPRTYTSHTEWCLHYAAGKCRACIRRCPAGAISEAGHDKERFKQYIRTVTAAFVEEQQLGFRVNSCGFCQTKVPCEKGNPTARLQAGCGHR